MKIIDVHIGCNRTVGADLDVSGLRRRRAQAAEVPYVFITASEVAQYNAFCDYDSATATLFALASENQKVPEDDTAREWRENHGLMRMI